MTITEANQQQKEPTREGLATILRDLAFKAIEASKVTFDHLPPPQPARWVERAEQNGQGVAHDLSRQLRLYMPDGVSKLDREILDVVELVRSLPGTVYSSRGWESSDPGADLVAIGASDLLRAFLIYVCSDEAYARRSVAASARRRGLLCHYGPPMAFKPSGAKRGLSLPHRRVGWMSRLRAFA